MYQTLIELKSGEPFLQSNILKEAYQNVEHYLDVQFRLLREYFISSLREGIQFYKYTMNDQHQKNK